MPLFWYGLAANSSLRSISQSYHEPETRDGFVGLLFAVAALFLSFSGKYRYERYGTILAGLLAVIVALVPCANSEELTSAAYGHYLAAVGLFVILGGFCWRVRKTALGQFHERKYEEARYRAGIYSLCLAGMLGCFALGLSGYFLKDAIKSSWPTFIFCLEALGLMSFGLSWLTAIRVLPITTHR